MLTRDGTNGVAQCCSARASGGAVRVRESVPLLTTAGPQPGQAAAACPAATPARSAHRAWAAPPAGEKYLGYYLHYETYVSSAGHLDFQVGPPPGRHPDQGVPVSSPGWGLVWGQKATRASQSQRLPPGLTCSMRGGANAAPA